MPLTDKIFIDANVLVEIIHERKHFAAAIDYVRQHAGQLAISPLTVHLVMYFGLKIASQQSLEQLLSDYTILPLSSNEVDWAFRNIRDHDFEDALQIGCAVSGDCSQFVTLDRGLVRRYSTLSNTLSFLDLSVC